MIGFVRRHQTARGYGLPLEVTALALERGSTRVVLIGVDNVGIQAPEADEVRTQAAEASGAEPAGVLLNWNHTHCAPAGSRSLANLGGPMSDELDPRSLTYIDFLHSKITSVARLASERLEPARVVWGVGRCEQAVNRREKDREGRVILGWDPEGLVDPQVTVLQARRPDESAIATVVGYGCHTVTVGPDVLDYSADYPGPMREAVRAWTGGECVFLQGAGGNVLPRVAFCETEDEAERFGRRLALEALHAVSGRAAWPRRIVRHEDGSVTPFSLYRFEPVRAEPPVLAAVEERADFPLLPLPTPDEISTMRGEFDTRLEEARMAGADEGKLNTLRYNAHWARRTERTLLAGTAPTSAHGPVHAIRIGDGAIVTGPGEIFAEIGIAVRERSPAEATLYAGYTNGAVSYFPTAASYPEGGYEPGYGNRSYGLPAQVAPECERTLVETGVGLVRDLFPEREAPEIEGWTATGRLPDPPPPTPYERPPLGAIG
jgi:neutral ceramidase